MKLIIIGGVAAGASAATRARRLAEDAEIVLFERGPEVSFASCGLPYYIGGEITDRDRLLVVTPERMRERFRIDVRVRTSVEKIDRGRKVVQVRSLADGRTYEEGYDRLILATGAAPVRPPLPGIDLPGVYTLRNLQDMERIRTAVDQSPGRALVVGAGFIGLELVENLHRRGVPTTLVELQDQVLPPLDREMAQPIRRHLLEKKIDVRLGQSVKSMEAAPGGVRAHLDTGEDVTAALVVLGIGVRPESQLAREAGLDVGPRGGVRVNAHMQTVDPDVYAAGDVAEVRDFVTGEPTQVPLAGPASRQGRVAADHIFGRPSSYRGTQGTAILRVFELTAAMTGVTEKMLRRLGRPFQKAYVHPGHHASYYPGAEPMILKLLFDPADGRILGAQGVGKAGVDRRIDVLAVAIQAGMTVEDLEEMELAYSPQYGSVKDPVNMLGFVAAGIRRGDQPAAHAEDLLAGRGNGLFLLDVRTPAEHARGAIPGAVNIPVDELRERLGELPRDRPIVTYCQVGQRGYLATRLLLQRGFRVANLAGGYQTWRQHQPAG